MAALGVWLWADSRTRRRPLLALALFVGLATGVVLAATAGARRTASSLDRLAVAGLSADVLVDLGPDGAVAAGRIDGLPSVEHASAALLVFAVLEGVSVDVGLLVPVDEGIGSSIERDRLLRGRRPDPADPAEVLLDETTARLLARDVGDRLQIATLTPEQASAERYFPAEGPRLDVRVTGVTRGVEDVIGREEGLILGTPALRELIASEVDVVATYVAVELRPGAGVGDLEADLRAELGRGATVDLLPFDVRTAAARRTIGVLATGLGVLAIGAAVAAAVVLAQAVTRHVVAVAGDFEALRAVGFTPRQLRLGLVLGVVPVAVLASAIAMAAAAASSPLLPIGLARQAEPDPGVRIDGAVLAAGGLAVSLFVLTAAATAAARTTRQARTRRIDGTSATAAAAGRVGAGPALVNGLALALQRHRPGAPVRSGLTTLVFACAAGAALVTFTASSDRFVGDRTRWGTPWDLALDFTSDEVDEAARVLAEQPFLDAVSRWDAGRTLVAGTAVRAYALAPIRGQLGFTLTNGRQPEPGEVVLGPATAARAGVVVGDVVAVGRPGDEGTAPMTVVGIGVFPEIDEGDFNDAVGLTAVDFTERADITELYEASQVVLRVADGISVTEAVTRLRPRFGGALLEPLPAEPGVVRNLAGVGSIPRALLGFVALLGCASLAHSVRTTVRRNHDHYATLRALGMTPRQVRSCSAAMGLTLTVLALAVGLPVGVAIGRGTWRTVAGELGVATDPLVPAGAVTLIPVAGLLAATVIALTLGRPNTRNALR